MARPAATKKQENNPNQCYKSDSESDHWYTTEHTNQAYLCTEYCTNWDHVFQHSDSEGY